KRYQGASKLVEDIKDESSDLGIDRDSSEGEGHSSEGEGHGSEEEGPGSKDKGPSIKKEDEAEPEGQQQAVSVMDTVINEPLGLGYKELRCCKLALGEGSMPNTFEVGQSSRSILEHEGERGYLHLDIPPLLQSFTITRVVPSPIDSPVTTLASTISVDKDQFLRVMVQLELHGSLLHDHTQRLDVLPPALFEGYDRDLRELYTRSGMRENHDLRRQIVEERLKRLKLLDRVVRMEKRQESRGGVVDYMRFLIRSLYTIKLSRFSYC
nr:hypothetical protein [Tanacetum cinerariifolium]